MATSLGKTSVYTELLVPLRVIATLETNTLILLSFSFMRDRWEKNKGDQPLSCAWFLASHHFSIGKTSVYAELLVPLRVIATLETNTISLLLFSFMRDRWEKNKGDQPLSCAWFFSLLIVLCYLLPCIPSFKQNLQNQSSITLYENMDLLS